MASSNSAPLRRKRKSEIERGAFALLERLPADLACRSLEAESRALGRSRPLLNRIALDDGSKGETNVAGDDIPERGLILEEAIRPRFAEALDGGILDFLFALLADIGSLGEAENVLGVELLMLAGTRLFIRLGRAEPQKGYGEGDRQQFRNRRPVCFHGAARTRSFLALDQPAFKRKRLGRKS